MTTKKVVDANLKTRDAEWRDALCPPGTAPDFWRTSGPQTPAEAAIFVRERDRVDDEWRTWLLDRLRKKKKAPQPPPEERWGYGDSEHPESWEGMAGSREEALRDGREHFGSGVEFWIQKGTLAVVESYLPDAQRFLEDMEQRAADNGCPDAVDEPFTLKAGAKEALEKALESWARKYVETNWWEPSGLSERVAP
jgi:hypothetical protein